MDTCTVNAIYFEDNGTKVCYEYSLSDGIKHLFQERNVFYAKYDRDVSQVPKSLLIIPLLGNIATISWFGGFKLIVDELDKDYLNSLEKLKAIFQKNYPSYKIKGEVVAKQVINNSKTGDRSALLFSGGVDAFASYTRIRKESPDLITIKGADIKIKDTKAWDHFLKFNESEKAIESNPKEYIESNLRDFYSYKVDLLIKDLGWWGKIQHGMGLISLLAPLSHLKGYSKIYIASSYTDNIDLNWGSTPEIDQTLSWSGLQVFHDGYELKRQDKVDLIANYAATLDYNLRLRVCYSELNQGLNCSSCEKCYRTILGIILAGQDPNEFGFRVTKSVYPSIFKKLETAQLSKGSQYFWWELMEKARNVDHYFIFSDEEYERSFIDRIRNGELDRLFDTRILEDENSSKQKYKYILRNKFSKLYSLYRRLKN